MCWRFRVLPRTPLNWHIRIWTSISKIPPDVILMDVESEERTRVNVKSSFSALLLGVVLLPALRSRWAKRWNYRTQVDLLGLASDSWPVP